jgi:hypothetical protein
MKNYFIASSSVMELVVESKLPPYETTDSRVDNVPRVHADDETPRLGVELQVDFEPELLLELKESKAL